MLTTNQITWKQCDQCKQQLHICIMGKEDQKCRYYSYAKLQVIERSIRRIINNNISELPLKQKYRMLLYNLIKI